jgi:hypothetical protein
VKEIDFLEKINVFITSRSEGMSAGSLRHFDIEKVEVTHNKSNGKDEVVVKINGEVIFKYDSNFKGRYTMNNHIQTPIKEEE